MKMGCDLSSSSSSSCAVSDLLMDLPLPLLEATLASLPLRSVLALSCSSKDLHSLVSSLSFCRLHSLSPPNSSPWFFLFGFNHLLPFKNQAFAFDPSSLSWIRFPFLPPAPHINSPSLSAINGSLFAFAGATQSRLWIASSPLKQNWQEIEASMAVGRKNPMLGIFFGNPCSTLTMRSIVVAGGIEEDADNADELAVEVYDMEKRRWKRCESMPEVLKGKSLSSAIVGGRFYVGDCEGGAICWLERGEERWVEGKVEMPRGVISWQWVGSQRAGLLAVALCGGSCVKVYKMEEGGSKMEEVAEMPAELYELFEEEDERQVVVRSCAGGDNLLYVYSDSSFKDYAACVCELGGGGGSRWYKLPPLPSPRHNFNRVACLSSPVPLSSCTVHLTS